MLSWSLLTIIVWTKQSISTIQVSKHLLVCFVLRVYIFRISQNQHVPSQILSLYLLFFHYCRCRMTCLCLNRSEMGTLTHNTSKLAHRLVYPHWTSFLYKSLSKHPLQFTRKTACISSCFSTTYDQQKPIFLYTNQIFTSSAEMGGAVF